MKQVNRAKKRRLAQRHERGFALLLVFLLASAVALMLYRQLPREAFESERDKEQMLIDRGEQYKRAIYLYYVQNNRQWPSKIEDLESTNNHRYLRRRYVDPYTGKDEWRLVHTNGTFLTDSLVTPPPAQGPGATPGGGPPGTAVAGTGGAAGTTGTNTATSSLFTSLTNTSTTPADPNAPPEVNAQVQRRPSDRTLVQNSNFNQPGGTAPNGNDPGYQPFNPNAPISLYPTGPTTGGQNNYNPSALPPISLFPNGYNAPSAPGGNGQPGLNQTGIVQPGVNQPGIAQPGFNQPGFNQPGLNQPGLNQPGLNQPGVPGFTLPGTNTPITPGVNPSTFNPFNQPGAIQGTAPGTIQGTGINPPITNPPGVGGNPPFPVQQFPPQQNIALDPNQMNAPGNAPGNVQGFGAAPVGPPGVPGAPGAPANAALGLINNLLTTPRQPPAAINPQSQAGGGLAGVASTYKGAAIKSYADRTKYQEWEFVFQLNPQGTLQAPQGTGPNGQGQGGPGGGTGGAGGALGTTPPGAAGTGFGNTGPGGATSGNSSLGFGTH